MTFRRKNVGRFFLFFEHYKIDESEERRPDRKYLKGSENLCSFFETNLNESKNDVS